ncbi:MAG: DUF58 domain-containing protein [Acidimicrobiales bacterium]
MTRFGIGAGLVGLALLVGGWMVAWPPVVVLGAGFVVLVAGAVSHVLYPPRVRVERAVEPPRVEKGLPAIALVYVANLSRRTFPALTIEQRLGDRVLRAVLPRLQRGQTSLRTYRLPTSKRGVYDVGPIEIPRGDPFGLCRRVQRLGEPQRIAVHPRLLHLRPLSTGISRNLEGPSSDSSPQGSITFHNLRDYVVGDDLRNIHWPSTARLGHLVVRHNVDTAQPYTVVIVDLDPAVYSAETFAEAVDVAASVAHSMADGKAPVQLRTTRGDHLGGPGLRDATVLIDHLTEVAPEDAGSLSAELNLLRRDRGGTALVVVTGRLDRSTLPAMAVLRRRFDRIVVVSMVAGEAPTPAYPGIKIVVAERADAVAKAWNGGTVR